MGKGKFKGRGTGRAMPGGGGMNNLLAQAQKMQAEMDKAQAELADKVYETTSGGGAIKITINGNMEIQKIAIDPDVIDPQDPSMLEDLLLVAVNDAVKAVTDDKAGELGKLTGGMNIPGLF